MIQAFSTLITDHEDAISGPWRKPRNMLSDQTYDGHASVHDDDTAQKMGFAAAPVEGPTHFSQFAPLCCHVWGEDWLARGGLSISYKAAVGDGEEVMAFIGKPVSGETLLPVWMVKQDGTEVLRGTALLGSDNPPTALEEKIAKIPPPDPQRVIYQHVQPGAIRPRVTARISYDKAMGQLYPFTLREKLSHITEASGYFEQANKTPWGGSILPIEMISVLVHHIADSDPWLAKKSTIDLFVDQEIRLFDGPLLADTDYEIERTLIALSGSRRTESYWVRSDIYLPGQKSLLARMLLNVGSFKDSYADYEAEQAVIISNLNQD